MPESAYRVAVITRGTGAYSYSYRGPEGLARGVMAAVSFQHGLELGIVLHPETQPDPAVELLELAVLQDPQAQRLGLLLSDLAEMAAAQPVELTGSLNLSTKGLRLKLDVLNPAALSEAAAPALAPFTRALSARQGRGLLRALGWPALVELCGSGSLSLSLAISGTPEFTPLPAKLRKHYELDIASANLLGLPAAAGASLPGSYLAGFKNGLELATAAVKPVQPASSPVNPGAIAGLKPQAEQLRWQEVGWPDGWSIVASWPQLARLRLRRAQSAWRDAAAADGIASSILAAVSNGGSVLVMLPQSWMADALWPRLLPLAGCAFRYRADDGPGATAALLSAARRGPIVVVGTESVWRIAAYAQFAQAIIVDPTHPTFDPGRESELDPRTALLLALANRSHDDARAAQVSFVELGVSVFDGAPAFAPLELFAQHEPPAGSAADAPVDSDPLPLELRQPGLRRLICFNRLGRGRGISCAECLLPVGCPACGSRAIYYAARERAYACSSCEHREEKLRCQRCGLMTLMAHSAGLEAVGRRPGDIVVAASERYSEPDAGRGADSASQRLLGTTALLETQGAFWPQQVVYVAAQGSLGLLSEWPQALDMAVRLASLYASPELETAAIVSTRIAEQFGARLSFEEVRQQYALELKLRRLAQLPPFACLYSFRASSSSRPAIAALRTALGEMLSSAPGTVLLRMSQPYAQGRYLGEPAIRLSGVYINPSAGQAELQQMRQMARELKAALRFFPKRGPWF